MNNFGSGTLLLSSNFVPIVPYLVQFSLHSLLYGGMAGEDAERPAQHHWLGLGADDEYLAEDGGQALFSERILALVHLLQIQVLDTRWERSVSEWVLRCRVTGPDPHWIMHQRIMMNLINLVSIQCSEHRHLSKTNLLINFIIRIPLKNQTRSEP